MKSKPIKYYSSNLRSPEVSFREALLKGLAPDGGLYLPDSLPQVSGNDLKSFHSKEYCEIAFNILFRLIGTEVDREELLRLCTDAYDFDVPLEKVSDRKYIMRLDRGPTASFKDFAARMMSRLMQYFLSADNKQLTILTATSGDTGSAVASAFYRLKNIKAIILFPMHEVTDLQRKQMTTLRQNIRVIAIDGKFDDCQRLVKTAFMDPDLANIHLTSANSINIGRLLPQAVYYFYAFSKLVTNSREKAIFSVPSGNFGNLMGGLIAKNMGLPVDKFIISTNENNEVPEYLRTGTYELINPSKNCISSAMNVGHPSNLARIVAIYGGIMNSSGTIIKPPDIDSMRRDLYAVSVTDDDTRNIIREIYRDHNLLLEPHGAIAWMGVKQFSATNKHEMPGKRLFISLETAHPAKFPKELELVLNIKPSMPAALECLDAKEEDYMSLGNEYSLLKDAIFSNY